jgi:hypothetical protein
MERSTGFRGLSPVMTPRTAPSQQQYIRLAYETRGFDPHTAQMGSYIYKEHC